MKIKVFLKYYIFVFIAISNIYGCAENHGGPYYVNINGNDNASGKSPEKAWRTIARVNETYLNPGDTVFFRAGDIWRETLEIKQSGDTTNDIVYTRYGEGENPAIYGSELALEWVETGVENIWKSTSKFTNVSKEYYGGRIFFLSENKTITWGVYKEFDKGFSNILNEYDYTMNGLTLYIYSMTNPSNRYSQVEVTQRQRCIRIIDGKPESYIEINGIDLKFSRIFGFASGYPAFPNASNLTIRNCNIGYIGAKGSGAAYGISAWHSDFLVENCTITDCGRRGISLNLYLQMPRKQHRNISNVVIRNNIFKRGYHTTSLDLACTNITGDTIQDIFFYNNYIDDSEIMMYEDDAYSNQIFTQSGGSYMNRIYIFCNVFIHATGRNILIEGGDSVFIWNNSIMGHNPNISKNPYANVSLNFPNQVDYRNNIIFDNLQNNSLQNHGVLKESKESYFMEKDYNLYFSLFPKHDRNFTASHNDKGQMSYYQTRSWGLYKFENSRFEQHSFAPQNPLFKSIPLDLRLQEGSPAIGAGVEIGLIKTDFLGNPMNNPPDIGAIQYIDSKEK